MSHADYTKHWDEKFSTRDWGRYPPEDLVRFMGRNFSRADRSGISVLEVGCGPGANLWFLHREGFRVAGIDGSPAAIEKARSRLELENRALNSHGPDLKVGNFSTLPWTEGQFDVVVDIFALYANPLPVIRVAVDEIHRVLKKGGRFYSKVWGRNTTGYGEGKRIEEGTYDSIATGPCKDMGVSHFFSREELASELGKFRVDAMNIIARTDAHHGFSAEEILCECTKT